MTIACHLLLCSSLVAVQADEVVKGEKAGRLDALLSSCVPFGFAGAAAVRWKGEIILQKGYGAAGPGAEGRNDPATLFEAGPVKETLVAAAILKLEEGARVKLGDHLSRYLPGVPDAYAGLTLHHLLVHASGISVGPAPAAGASLEEAVRGVLPVPPRRPPGVSFEPDPRNTALLIAVVEQVTGLGFASFCTNELLKPAGLYGIVLAGTPPPPGCSSAQALVSRPERPEEWADRGRSGLCASVLDLLRWTAALESGRILSSGSRRRMSAPQFCDAAYGRRVAEDLLGGRKLLSTGRVRGFTIWLADYPDQDAAVALAANGRAGRWLCGEIERLLFGRAPTRPVPACAGSPPEVLDVLAGAYALGRHGRVVVSREGGGLRLLATGVRHLDLLRGRPDAAAGRFDSETRQAEGLFAALEEGDDESVDAAFAPAFPRDLVRAARVRWSANAGRSGRFIRSRLVGSETEGGRDLLHFLVRRKHGEDRVALAFEGPFVAGLDLDAPEYPFEAFYMQSPDGRFEAFDLDGRPAAPIRFERLSSGKVRRMLVEQGAGRPVALKPRR